MATAFVWPFHLSTYYYHLDRVTIQLPAWLHAYESTLKDVEFETDEAMMAVAVEISDRNVKEGTGGPFGCAIFEKDTNTSKSKLFAVGANRVVPLTNSTIHGETCAIQFAEKKLKSFSLRSTDNGKQYIMCTSCEPCAMCLGGTFWAAPAEMICGATKDDAESIGFNEGPVCKYRLWLGVPMYVPHTVLFFKSHQCFHFHLHPWQSPNRTFIWKRQVLKWKRPSYVKRRPKFYRSMQRVEASIRDNFFFKCRIHTFYDELAVLSP